MAELTRISISLEEALLAAFDRSAAARGYTNRSEAIRDLIRDHLVREESRAGSGGRPNRLASYARFAAGSVRHTNARASTFIASVACSGWVSW